jgi:hypothetical protein
MLRPDCGVISLLKDFKFFAGLVNCLRKADAGTPQLDNSWHDRTEEVGWRRKGGEHETTTANVADGRVLLLGPEATKSGISLMSSSIPSWF